MCRCVWVRVCVGVCVGVCVSMCVGVSHDIILSFIIVLDTQPLTLLTTKPELIHILTFMVFINAC